jgi:hypothetical protein
MQKATMCWLHQHYNTPSIKQQSTTASKPTEIGTKGNESGGMTGLLSVYVFAWIRGGTNTTTTIFLIIPINNYQPSYMKQICSIHFDY